jgi:hypothetical protein
MGRGKEGEMTQTLYAHMNKRNKKRKEKKRHGDELEIPFGHAVFEICVREQTR